MVAGYQVPEMPLEETAGNTGADEYWNKGPTEDNIVIICGLMVISWSIAMLP